MKHAILLFALFIAIKAGAQNSWPKDIPTSDGGRITMYEPQPESLSGNKLTGRAAVSVRKSDTDEPVFGAIFFTATLSTDKSSRMAELESLTVTNAKFSGLQDQAQVDQLAALIQKDAPNWNLSLSIDDLVASIKQDNASKNEQFQNDAPDIIYATRPTTLVVLDGAPQVQNDKNLGADKVVNSPNLIFKEGSQWNMYAGGIWYRSASVTSGWKPNTNLSAKVRSVNDQIKKQEAENNDGKTVTEAPRATDIIVATQPTELLQTDGDPDFKTIQGTSLLYVSNSPNEIFKDINSQLTYVLIAGRWYNAPAMKGPWTYVPADKLPEDFAKIPEGSDKDGVLSNVAGTDAAEEAKIDAEIPQTAKVDRKTATIDVQYDGPPQFHQIEGTSLQLAENSNLTVMIDASGNYFALDNGVWFIARGPSGPWSVANDRPRDVDDIPANSPAYNSKYVYIYDQTPDYVYCGYTSGYLGSYIYGPTIVYGTGFHYRPWYRHVYYPRPVTWGFGFNYVPWYGWSMNWGYNFGFMYVGFNFGRPYPWGGGWFGPPRYRPPYRPPYWSGGYYGRSSRPRPAFGMRPGAGNRPPTGGRPNINRPGSGWVNTNNLYNNHRGIVTRDIDRRVLTRPSVVGARPGARPDIGQNNRLPGNNNRLPNNNNNNRLPSNNNGGIAPGGTRPPASRLPNQNNVLTDRDGNIYRRDQQNNNWQRRDNSTRNWTPVPNDNNNRLPDLNRQERSRERAQTRENNFGRDAAPAPINRPSTAGRPAIMNRPAAPSRPSVAPSRPSVAPSRPSAAPSRSVAPSRGGGGGRPERR